MTGDSQNPGGIKNQATDVSPHPPASAHRSRRFSISHIVTLVVLVLMILYNLGEFLKSPTVEEIARDKSMFAIPSEMSERYKSCDYKLLFYCEPKAEEIPEACKSLTGLARSGCILSNNGHFDPAPARASGLMSFPFIAIPAAAVITLPRMPDATIHVLRTRWNHGSIQFSLALVFVAAYVTLMVLALRSKEDAKLWIFATAVVVGPYLVIAAFSLLQHLLSGASATTEKFAAFMVSGLGLPACLLVCIRHDAESLLKTVKGVH